ncbi:glutamate--cysteine ligase [Arthrobacter sp. E918]|uniref:Putative glutamate--cysteine ligase 2 n=2 Tax=Arthrobacter mobilis TaxID=2724944 RepID=A0A7X6HB65_9MICC|nr:glutamate--cysteine ligase [Arthrobacter mobilis]
MIAFGIEEEFLLLDPATAQPRPVAPLVRAGVPDSAAGAFQVSPELLACQIETATPVCHLLSEAVGSLQAFRSALAAAAGQAGAVAAGIGVVYDAGHAPAVVSDVDRYQHMQASTPALIADEYVTGMHVHAEVVDPDSRVQVMNRCRRWLPTFVALTANSPYWNGVESGFASWRSILYRRWPIQGAPPVFRDFADYQDRTRRLMDSGVAPDPGYISWLLRLSVNYPTLEFRCADSQLTAGDSVLAAALLRALAATEARDALTRPPVRQPRPEHLDIALWQAARNGLDGALIDLRTGQLVPARQQLDALLEHTRAALEELGDYAHVREELTRVLAEGNGAQRQRRAMHRGGLPAWLELARSSLTAS